MGVQHSGIDTAMKGSYADTSDFSGNINRISD